MSASLVSVIIPCYRQGHFLQECIDSLRKQSYPHWEAIIVNDGSPDNTREISLGLHQLDARVKYIEQKNAGLSAARNAGVARSEEHTSEL